MYGYNLRLAVLSIRRNPVLSVLMLVAIGLGIAVFLCLYTGYHLLLRDPMAGKSDRIYRVLVDSWQVGEAAPLSDLDEPPFLMTWMDAVNIQRSDIPTYHSPMYRTATYLHADKSPDTAGAGDAGRPVATNVRLTRRDFFAMFDVPFLYGGPWSRDADLRPDQVVVLAREMNQTLFGGADSVGKRVFFDRGLYTVVGVIDDWNPTPLFYNLLDSLIGNLDPAPFFAPFLLGDVNQWPKTNGMTAGWKSYPGTGWKAFTSSEQTWLQYWAQLDTAAQKAAFQDWLDAYTAEQKALGRFPRDPLNNQLYDVPTWIAAATRQIGGIARAFLMIGILFLVVCVTNLVSMLLGKFLEANSETALRRALGASRRTIFAQRLFEVGLLGPGGGVLGIVLTQGVLVALRNAFEVPDELAHLDLHLFFVALSLALVAGIGAGLLPAWRACRVAPAHHLNV